MLRKSNENFKKNYLLKENTRNTENKSKKYERSLLEEGK